MVECELPYPNVTRLGPHQHKVKLMGSAFMAMTNYYVYGVLILIALFLLMFLKTLKHKD